MAATETMTYEDSLNSQYLSNSLSSLHHSRSTNSLIVRSYKQASQLYLTKRFNEALETIEPIIGPQQTNGYGEHTNGHANGHANGEAHGPAPIAQSSRTTRTKVWNFYLALLHEIIGLGHEEGRQIFGSAEWKQLASKARDGSIWEEVVQRGYGGSEGEVDADVVNNLATLLLEHMQDQRLNQQRLETYLATSDSGGSNGHLSFTQDGMSTPMSSSSSSPKQLATRLRILELYTLHVLPANGEWDYAKSFIEVNDTLDDERKEAFLAALQNLRAEKDGSVQREQELQEQREREMEQQRREEEEQARRAEEARRQEEERRIAAEAERQKAAAAKALNGHASTPKPMPTPAAPKAVTSAARSSKPPQKKPPSPPPSFYRRASSVLTNLQQVVLQAGRNMNFNSIAIARLVMFIFAFVLILARRDLRLKVRRLLEDAYVKVKRTIGMGVKVSYI